MAQLILLWVIVWLIFIAKSAVPFFVGFPILTSWIPTCQKWESNWIPSSDKWESSWELDSHLSKTSGNLAPNFFMWLFGGFRPQNFLFRKQILFFADCTDQRNTCISKEFWYVKHAFINPLRNSSNTWNLNRNHSLHSQKSLRRDHIMSCFLSCQHVFS